jgi:FkbM family methyltransferase
MATFVSLTVGHRAAGELAEGPNVKHLSQQPLARDAARFALAPVRVRRRVPGTPYRVRFPAAQYLGWIPPRGMKKEQGIARRFREHIRPGDTVIDVGANIGIYTMLAAELVGPSGHVHAFEPDPQSMCYLLTTINRNGLTGRVTLWNLAASDRSAHAQLYLDLKTARTTSLRANAYAPDPQRREPLGVGTAALDDLITQPPQFVKIDVEGAELAVLAGMARLLRDHHPVLLVEVLPENVPAVTSFLAPLEYCVVDAESGVPLGSGEYTGDVLAIPRCG